MDSRRFLLTAPLLITLSCAPLPGSQAVILKPYPHVRRYRVEIDGS